MAAPMDLEQRIAALRLEHAQLLRLRTDALLELSAASFNHPRLHDSAHSSPCFLRWRDCTRDADRIEDEIAQARRGLAPVDPAA